MSETNNISNQSQDITPFFNPFPGLRPFTIDESHLFFGREGQNEDVLANLAKNKFVAVIGASGSGKSSLVRAGMLPALELDGRVITESDDILAALEAEFGALAGHAMRDPAVVRVRRLERKVFLRLCFLNVCQLGSLLRSGTVPVVRAACFCVCVCACAGVSHARTTPE